MTTHKRRHVPLRTCVICGNKTSKRELARIVATPLGAVVIDPTGRLAGRGTYVCKDGLCVHEGLKRGRLEHALRTKLKDDEWAGLLSAVEVLSDSR
jgi:predicted RNA-binding protein YlxR (DUF448 family)